MENSRLTHELLKRAVPKQKWKDFGAVFLIVIFLPYICVVFFGNKNFAQDNASLGSSSQLEDSNQDKSSYYVKKEVAAGIELIPLEDYLIGLTAANIPMDVLDETMKAQITILRTTIIKKCIQGENSCSAKASDLSLEYLSRDEMKTLWGSKYEDYYNRIKSLVKSTKGIIITYKSAPIEAPFFAISAGTTRDASEVLGSKNYPYLISVNSEKDMFAEDYLEKKVMEISEFNKLIKIAYPNLKEEDENSRNLMCEKDAAGYILSIQLGNTKLSGEEFRKIFSLNSSFFELVIEEENITITTKGLGHGLGFSQFGGNQLAKDGMEFIEIIKYYYSNVEIEKTE